jgi:hypothetical protein
MRKALLAMVGLAFFLAGFGLSAPPQKSARGLPDNHRKWLEEDVVYVITPKEKDVFLKLENDRERDPSPNTSENEFKTEHFRRVAYANQWLGRDSPGSNVYGRSSNP